MKQYRITSDNFKDTSGDCYLDPSDPIYDFIMPDSSFDSANKVNIVGHNMQSREINNISNLNLLSFRNLGKKHGRPT